MSIPPHGSDDDIGARRQFEQFFDANLDMLRAWIAWKSPSVDEEAVANDAFLETWRHWDDLDEPRAFLFKAAWHGLLNGVRSARRRLWAVSPDDGHTVLVSPMGDVHQREELFEVIREVERLPPRLRDTLKLTAFGLSNDEIAEVIGCTSETVSTYLSRARRRLCADRSGSGDRCGGSGPGGRRDRGDV